LYAPALTDADHSGYGTAVADTTRCITRAPVAAS
jgi:hypothetical protein